MYDWLPDALGDSSQVVTASGRLSRALATEFGRQQIAAGKTAWRSPAISSWQDWLGECLADAAALDDQPTRINSHQSQLLWERCLARETSDPLLNLAALVRQVRDTWVRLHEWRVTIDACASSGVGQDQRLFVRAARNYQSILKREHWVDDSGLTELLIRLIRAGQVSVPRKLVLAGFDRIVPQVQGVLDVLQEAGSSIDFAVTCSDSTDVHLHVYDNADAEMRAAGAWARHALDQSADLSIAIISSDLQQDSAGRGRLIREGLVPGWQYSGPRYASAVNVSFGMSLRDYPAIDVAMRALRWLYSDLGTRDISLLLRSSMIGSTDVSGRSRLELFLRQLPDRNWSPKMLLGVVRELDDTADSLDWCRRIGELATRRNKLPHRDSPSSWAVVIDDLLRSLNWPGEATLSSVEFQLVNRWRDLLNELARLELISASMTFGDVLGRLNTMAGETVFQPEGDDAAIHLMGPLEAAGMQFDRIWVCGLTSEHWPPAGRPLALVSRELQRRHGMPDAEPQDTMEYARRVLERIIQSAPGIALSYPKSDGDVDQSFTSLLRDIHTSSAIPPTDPAWHGETLRSAGNTVHSSEDRVPVVAADELVSGGATTIQRQLSDPISAFAAGRLGVRSMQRISNGLSASLRGNLIHDALDYLYRDLPSQSEIAAWQDDERRSRIDNAVQAAFARHERYVDPVLKELLLLERWRAQELLSGMVTVELGRESFAIAEVEQALDVALSGIRLKLRIDRQDRLDDGSLIILDYKTGAKKRFLDGQREPLQIQLVVYACAVNEAVAGLGLINIDSRSIDFDGAGRSFTSTDSWDEDLLRWKSRVMDAAAQIQRGDVSINMLLGGDAIRPLSLLSRVEELRHDS